MLLTIEGVDNVGKTTLCKALNESLSRTHPVLLVSDPPDIDPWMSFKHELVNEQEMVPIARALGFLAARTDGYQRVILPALRERRIILSDRFTDCWVAYQSVWNRRKFKSMVEAVHFFESVNDFFVKRGFVCVPDKTFLLKADFAETQKRGRDKEASVFDDPDFQKTVQRVYLGLARKYPRRINIVNTRGKSLVQLVETLESRVRSILEER